MALAGKATWGVESPANRDGRSATMSIHGQAATEYNVGRLGGQPTRRPVGRRLPLLARQNDDFTWHREVLGGDERAQICARLRPPHH